MGGGQAVHRHTGALPVQANSDDARPWTRCGRVQEHSIGIQQTGGAPEPTHTTTGTRKGDGYYTNGSQGDGESSMYIAFLIAKQQRGVQQAGLRVPQAGVNQPLHAGTEWTS